MTFNGKRSEQLKLEGMETAAFAREQWLAIGRGIAVELGIRRGEITADDVGRVLRSRHGIDSLGPAAGSLFKTKDWEFTGKFKKSARVSNHSRLLRVWRYIGGQENIRQA